MTDKHQRSESMDSVNIVTDEDYTDEDNENQQQDDNHLTTGRNHSQTVVTKEEGDHERRSSSLFGEDSQLLKRIMTSYGNSMDLADDMGDQLQQLQQEANEMLKQEESELKQELGNQFGYTPEEEIALQKDIQEKINRAFQKYMPEDSHDVDEDEFTQGILKMKTDLKEIEIRKLFQWIDNEDEGYITKDDVQTFLNQPYSNPELQQLKSKLLKAMIGAPSVHGRHVSSIVKHGEEQFWSQAQLNLVEEEMKKQLLGLTTNLQEKVTKEQHFENEMKKLKEEDPDLFEDKNARKWTSHQVVDWLLRNDMEYCAKNFFKQQIDGDILLHDLDDYGLSQLGVRPLHIRQFRRKITDLKKIIRGVTDILLEEEEVYNINIEDTNVGELLRLRSEIDNALDERDKYKKEIEQANNKISILESTINAFKETGFIPDEIILEIENSLKQNNINIDNINSINNNSNNNIDLPVEIPQNEDTVESQISEEPTLQSQNSLGNQSTISLTSSTPIQQKSLSFTKSTPLNLGMGMGIGGGGSSELVKNARLVKMLKKKKEDIEQKDDEDTFCAIDNVKTWNHEEVAYWIGSINFQQYTLSFYNMITDGEMLLYDVDKETLKEDLKVRKIHSRRILQEIANLKRQLIGKWDEVFCFSNNIESDPDKPTKEQLEELNKKIEDLENQKKQLMNELSNLQNPDENNDENEENDQKGGFFVEQIEKLEQEKTELEQKKQELEDQFNNDKTEFENKINNLTNTNNELNDKIKIFEENEIKKDEELNDIEKKLKTWQNKYKKLKKKKSNNNDDDDDDESEEEEDLDENENVNIDEILKPIKLQGDEDPEFGDPKDCENWSNDEVLFWLSRIQLEDYVYKFQKLRVDGNILINDIDKTWLKKDIKVKSLHLKQILRQIDTLRGGIGLSKKFDNNGDIIKESSPKIDKKKQEEIEREEKLKKEREETQNQLETLRTELDDEIHKNKGYILEINELKKDLEENDPTIYQKQIAELNSLLEYESKRKNESISKMNDEINTLRYALKVMQREISWLEPLAQQTAVEGVISWLGFGKNNDIDDTPRGKRGRKKRGRRR